MNEIEKLKELVEKLTLRITPLEISTEPAYTISKYSKLFRIDKDKVTKVLVDNGVIESMENGGYILCDESLEYECGLWDEYRWVKLPISVYKKYLNNNDRS